MKAHKYDMWFAHIYIAKYTVYQIFQHEYNYIQKCFTLTILKEKTVVYQ